MTHSGTSDWHASIDRMSANRLETKAIHTLMGIVTGIVADGEITAGEIRFLRAWLAEHDDTARAWPGCAIAQQLAYVLDDGVITTEERAHLLCALSELANSDFAATGSAQAEPLALPIDDSARVNMLNAGIVHTGVFMFGTRAACERFSLAMGAMPLDNVSRHTDVLVIGTRVTPTWASESYGRKIMKAANMRASGHHIRIISERFWFDHSKDQAST